MAQELGVRTRTTYLWKKGTPVGSLAILRLIVATGVSARWLRTGEGRMYAAAPPAINQGRAAG